MRRLVFALAVSISALLVPAASAQEQIAGRYIVVLETSVDHPGQVAAQHEAEYGAESEDVYRDALAGYSAEVPRAELPALRADDRVRAVVPDEVLRLASPPPNTEIPAPLLHNRQQVPTGVRRIGGLQSPTAGIDGRDNRVNADVAVIDTGLDAGHRDLDVARTKNCVGKRYRPDNHGTHVAGTIGALDNRIGVVGVAPGARIWSIRIFDEVEDTTLSTLLCSLDFVAAHRTIEVLNMSVGFLGTDGGNCGRNDDDPFYAAICVLTDNDVTVVASAGNGSKDTANTLPAAYDKVVAVSALADYDGRPGGKAAPTCFDGGVDDHLAWFSNFGADVDLMAPGVCILSSWWPLDYEYEIGTSMSSPHVAGAAALYYARHPGATRTQVRAGLRNAGTRGPFPGDPDGLAEPLVNVAGL